MQSCSHTFSLTAVLVEDEPLIQAFLSPILQQGGLRILSAYTAAEALRLIHYERGAAPGLLLTDVQLGGSSLTGWDVARRAREVHPKIGVVYMTGGRGAEWISHGVPKSILIGKPFALAQVLDAAARALVLAR
jgi:CheY-like chemotaxis protein